MLIPIESVTRQHEVRIRTGSTTTTWLYVDGVSTQGEVVSLLLNEGDLTYTAPRGRSVDARLPRHVTPVIVVTCVPGDTQVAEFANGTIQSGGSESLEFTLHTRVDLPEHVREDQIAAANFLERLLTWLSSEARRDGVELTFEAEIGPAS